ncbi:helix-turn-helix domain-containing protein [Chryseobacterium sp. KCF3-3]|uniref:helix-turn-helix domain-containing protein n=1 Tax=Chryseobacterium sp. KCF3-3 TaxID=3231511 RepID=UPI0038B2EC45
MKTDLEYISVPPPQELNHLIESIWMLRNHSGDSAEAIVLPDGKIDLFLFLDQEANFEIFMSGICNEPIIKHPFPKSVMFGISFYPTAAEYIFKHSFADSLNQKIILPADFMGFCRGDLDNFESFCKNICDRIQLILNEPIDNRKVMLFDLILRSKGEIKVEAVSSEIGWKSREMNRYFRKWLGITLKSYIDIIKFCHSLKQLKKGDFYPELNYADQSHFIRAVKRFSGSKPTVLSQNNNDRFIQLTVLPDE